MAEPKGFRGFEAHLAQALAAHPAERGDACLDAEVIAALLDGSLDPLSRAACDEHLAGCLRCRAIVAAASEAEAPLDDASAAEVSLPPGWGVAASADRGEEATEAAAPSGDVRVPGRVVPFRIARVARIAAPFAVAASLALAVWVARTARTPESDLTGQPSMPVAESRPRERDTFARPGSPAPAPAPAREFGEAGRAAAEAPRASTSPPARVVPKRQQPPLAPASTEEARTAAEAETPVAMAPAPRTGIAAAPPPAMAVPPRAAEKRRAGEDSVESTRQTVGLAGRAALAPGGEGRLIPAPSGRVAWQLHPGGRVVRVVDGRDEQLALLGEDLASGSAASDVVAWGVGRSGAIWRTTDGFTWTRVSDPPAEGIVTVQAESADAASVVSRDGTRLATRDGGRTWTPLAQRP